MTANQESKKELLDFLSAGIEMPRLSGVNGELLSVMHKPLEKIEMLHVASLVESDPALTAAVSAFGKFRLFRSSARD